MRHGDFRQLFGRGAEFLHVTVRGHRKGVGDRDAERHFVLLVAAFGQRAQRQFGCQTGQQAVAGDHQDRFRKSTMNGRGGHIELRRRRRARHLQGVRERRLDAEIFAESNAEAVERRCHRVARQHAIDLMLPDAGVGERLTRRVCSQPQRALAGHLADRRHADANDGHLAAQAIAGHGVPFASRASSSCRCTLPLVERGNSENSMNWNCRGRL